MKPSKRPFIAALVIVVFAAVLAAGWMTAGASAPPQETAEAPETTDEPLPDFQPSERLPADSAVAFPTDI
jgi:hypothetical protein